MTEMFGSKPPTQKLEITDFSDRIALRAGHLMVINDEAHHTHDEDSEWNKIIRGLHTKTSLTAQLDFSPRRASRKARSSRGPSTTTRSSKPSSTASSSDP